MARTVSLSGQTYTIPEQGDVGWGSLTDLLERLTADVNTLNSSTLATPTPLRRRVREITASPTTLLSTDDVVLVNIAGLSSINLPDPSTIDTGKVITVKDSSGAALTNTISVFGFGGSTIDGAAQYDINDNYGDASFVLRDDNNWSRIQSIDSEYENGLIPIGTVFAITTHLTGSWTLPASGAVKRGLMLCDGSAIPAGQTLSGTTPDLSDDRFLMGATTSGTSGVATDLTHSHTFAHTHGTNSQLGSTDFSHTHGGSTGAQSAAFTGTLNTSGGAASFDKTVMNTNQNSHNHDYSLVYTFSFDTFSKISGGGNAMLGAYDYNLATTVFGSDSPAASGRGWNSGLALSATTVASGTQKQLNANVSLETISWTSTVVNTTFTQPTLASTELNTNQTAHSHTIASDLGSVDLSHSHTTTTQSTSTTTDGLTSTDIRPKYFEAIYLIRVS